MKSSKQNSIPVEVYQVSEIVQSVVQDAPIGTNLALYQGLMTMMSGAIRDDADVAGASAGVVGDQRVT